MKMTPGEISLWWQALCAALSNPTIDLQNQGEAACAAMCADNAIREYQARVLDAAQEPTPCVLWIRENTWSWSAAAKIRGQWQTVASVHYDEDRARARCMPWVASVVGVVGLAEDGSNGDGGDFQPSLSEAQQRAENVYLHHAGKEPTT
jgi:hypothetical protein